MAKLIVKIGGKDVVLGEVFEDKLPRCVICGKAIGIDRVIRSLSLKKKKEKAQAVPLYDSQRCANVAANRDRHERDRKAARTATATPKRSASAKKSMESAAAPAARKGASKRRKSADE